MEVSVKEDLSVLEFNPQDIQVAKRKLFDTKLGQCNVQCDPELASFNVKQ